jgi:SAM-dependent methyltransferase
MADADTDTDIILDDPRTFFSGVALEFWNAIVPEELTEAEVEFLAGQFQGISGRATPRLLDIACGSGRHAIGLAKRRFSVTGLDVSREEILALQANAREAKVDVKVLEHDMRDLGVIAEGGSPPFDGAYVFGNALGYLDPEELHTFLADMGQLVREGGRLVLDTSMVAESVLHRFEDQVAIDAGDIKLVIENVYDAAQSRVLGTYTFTRSNGEVTVRHFGHWVVTSREVFEALEAAGFEVEKVFGDLDESPYELHDPRLIIVARR